MSNGDHIARRRHPINLLDTYDVSADELERIEQACMDVGTDFQFASNALAVGVSFFIALRLTRIDSPKVYACFFAVTLLMIVLCAYFAIQYFRKKSAIQFLLQRIKDRQVGPVGEEGKEMSQKELAALEVTQAKPISVSVEDDLRVEGAAGGGIAADQLVAEPAPAIAPTGEQK